MKYHIFLIKAPNNFFLIFKTIPEIYDINRIKVFLILWIGNKVGTDENRPAIFVSSWETTYK